MVKTLFNFIVFPGFLFTALVGILVSWIDRKVTARLQWRVGPPVLQPLYDFVKLLGKETIVPQGGSKFTFLLAPLFGLAAVTTVSTLLWLVMFSPEKTFLGDLVVVIYLLTIPSISLILGGFASGNPLASLGASREMKMILAYELPFILSIFTPVIKAQGIIRLGDLLQYQWANNIFVNSWSGIVAFVVAIICMQAKLALVPFDIPEAETEIIAGPYTDYSGVPLALHKLTRWMMLFVVPIFLVVVFMGGIKFEGWHILWGILKYFLLLAVIILIRNTNPRLRIDQAIRFFWGPMAILAVMAVIFAFLGL